MSDQEKSITLKIPEQSILAMRGYIKKWKKHANNPNRIMVYKDDDYFKEIKIPRKSRKGLAPLK
jgi:hypothetical protein